MSDWWTGCPCGHLWLFHDVAEYHGDGSDLCCVEGCGQDDCPGGAQSATTDDDAGG